jgi:hemophore-related protein
VHVRPLVAGIGIAAVAIAAPLVVLTTADAQSSPSTSSSPAADCPRQDLHKQVQDYLAAHPDVAKELTTLRAMPQDQRAQARKQYLAAHPDVATQLKQFRQDRSGAWAEAAGRRTAELDKYPAVQALLQDLARTPDGQRAAEAKKYLADHADARSQLKQLRSDTRSRLQACRVGG